MNANMKVKLAFNINTEKCPLIGVQLNGCSQPGHNCVANPEAEK